MVALNESFALKNPSIGSENRVGDFFGEEGKMRRVNRLSAQNPRLENGHGYDEAASGMFFYGFRYYDPVTGRWPSRDPLGEPGGLNVYAMVGNDALNLSDYLGLCVDCAKEETTCRANALSVHTDCVAAAAAGVAKYVKPLIKAEGIAYKALLKGNKNQLNAGLSACNIFLRPVLIKTCRAGVYASVYAQRGIIMAGHKAALATIVASGFAFKSKAEGRCKVTRDNAYVQCGNDRASCEAGNALLCGCSKAP